MFRRIGALGLGLVLVGFGLYLLGRDETECAGISMRRRGYTCLSEEEIAARGHSTTLSPDVAGGLVAGAGVLVAIEAVWLIRRDRALG